MPLCLMVAEASWYLERGPSMVSPPKSAARVPLRMVQKLESVFGECWWAACVAV